MLAYQLQKAQNAARDPPTTCTEPEITQALMQDHLFLIQAPETEGREHGIFATTHYIVEAKRPAVLPHRIDSLSQEVMKISNSSNDDIHMPAGRTPKFVYRVIQISSNVLEELAESVQQNVDVIMSDDNDDIKIHQTNQLLTTEIDHAMDKPTKAFNEAAEWQQKAHEPAQEQRDKADVLQGEEGS